MSQRRAQYHLNLEREAKERGVPLERVLQEREWVHWRDQAMQAGFIALPRFIWEAPALTLGAKVAYTELLNHSWQENQCVPGMRRMERHLGATENTIRTWLAELVSIGLITAERRGLGMTNRYRLEAWTPELVERLMGNQPEEPSS